MYCLTLELLRTQNSNSYKEKTTNSWNPYHKGFQLFSFIRAVFFQNNCASCFPCQHTYLLFLKYPPLSPIFQHKSPFHALIYTVYKCIYTIFMHNSAILYDAYRCPPSFLAFFTKQILFKPTVSLVLIGILPKICHLFSFCTTNSPNLYKYAYFY